MNQPEHIGEILKRLFVDLKQIYGGCRDGLIGGPPSTCPPLGVASNGKSAVRERFLSHSK
jgi:hypothetical protein